MNHKEFFDDVGYMTILTASMEGGFTIEDLYQAFKARMVEEKAMEFNIARIMLPNPDGDPKEGITITNYGEQDE